MSDAVWMEPVYKAEWDRHEIHTLIYALEKYIEHLYPSGLPREDARSVAMLERLRQASDKMLYAEMTR